MNKEKIVFKKMKADKNGIGLETAKLLERWEIPPRKEYCVLMDIRFDKLEKDISLIKQGTRPFYKFDYKKYPGNNYYEAYYPAYTWQEILWVHAEEFFGKKYVCSGGCSVPAYVYYSKIILVQLQRKEYQKAEQIFIDNCILLK